MDANANNIEATFDINTVELESDYDINSQNFDAIFEINAAGTTWGSIDGDIENQADLITVLNSKATNEALTALASTVTNNYTTLDTKIDGVQSDLSGDISVLNTAVQNEATTRANNDTLLQNGINTLTSNLSAEISNRTTADNTLQSNITAINNILDGYGNIVTHNVAEFATAAQGLLADTALQPNDNITKLTNNAGYITSSALNGYATEDFVTSQGYLSSISSSDVTNALGYTPYNATNPNGYISGINSTDVTNALGYTPYDSANPDGYITSASLPTVNNNTITIQKNSTDVGSFTLNQSSNDTINITVPTDTNDLTNGAGFITSASLPTLEDLTTTAQLAAINSGATTTNIGQIATNASNISAEVTNRQNADNALQSQIDAIVSSSDVFDIVGTYAELQAYDISTVPVNDIIKVLVDSTHSGAATYYRCVENNNIKSWSYIGSEGAYYTKGEADSKFVEQTITINGQPLSSNVTLTASDVNALPSSTTIGAGVLTVQKNGTTVNTFGANDTGNTTINITVPTDTGDLTNNAGFITGITGTDVTNALGYTPYDSSNPNGYTSNVGTVTSVNNVSPVSGNVTLSIPTATSDLTNDSGFLTSSDLTGYGQLSADQNWTGTQTFVGQKKIGFKQSGNSDKLGFTLYTSNNTEKGYLEFNPSNTVDSVPLMTLGNYASSSAGLTHVGFRKYSSVSGANGAYNLLTPLISDAKTPFNLTTTYTNFYLPLGFTDGTNTVKTAKSGLVDLSSLLPNSAVWGNITGTLADQTDLQNALNAKQDTLVSGTNIKTINSTSLLGNGDIKALQNTATGSGSLTINGTANVGQYGVNIGHSAGGTSYSVALGSYSYASHSYSIAIGSNAEATAYSAMQIGKGTNSTANSLSIGFNDANTNYQLLDGTTGLIPDARISSNIARISAIPDISNLISNTDYATTSSAGIVQPDGSTITVNNGVISATSTKDVGELVYSITPLTNAGLHLLNGSLIQGSGSYADFVTYIAGLVNDYPNLFVTEANWQASVTTYGVCGKFVYDSTNNTVRLPKITGIIEGTVDATALGDLVEAGLPNIISRFAVRAGVDAPDTLVNTTYSRGNSTASVSLSGDTQSVILSTDASLSSPIYGNSTTVQPQTIKAFIYIVIATSAKTDIQVDIDEIATDLNGKADTDGSNFVSSVKNFDGQWVIVGQAISTANTVGSYTLDISSLLPADNYKYEVILSLYMYATAVDVYYQSVETTFFPSTALNTVTGTGTYPTVSSTTALVIIDADKYFKYSISSNGNTSPSGASVTLCAYRRIGTNS